MAVVGLVAAVLRCPAFRLAGFAVFAIAAFASPAGNNPLGKNLAAVARARFGLECSFR